MRKYEKSLMTSEAVAKKIEEINKRQSLAQGNADQDLQPADRAGPCDDAQRAA